MKNFDGVSMKLGQPIQLIDPLAGGTFLPPAVRLARDLQQAKSTIARQAAQICSLRDQVRQLESQIRTNGAIEPLAED